MKRIGKGIFTLWAVITITFGLIRLLPGGPMAAIRAQILQRRSGSEISDQELNRLVELYANISPDKPLWQQYIDYLIGILQGDFGQSMRYNEPVMDIIVEAAPWTIFVILTSLIISFLIGITLGALMAYYENSLFDKVMSSISTLLNSVPFFLTGIILLYILAYQYSLFPTGGRRPTDTQIGINLAFMIGVLYHAALPIISMVVTEFGGWALQMRGNSISVLGEDFTYAARLRGVPDRLIAIKYVGWNAVLPMYTGLMIAVGFVLGGSVILERIFTYAGLGYYIISAINARDYSLMMGAFLVITAAVVASVLVADLTYGLIDPRVGGESNEQY